MSVIPAIQKLRQDSHNKVKASMGGLERSCLKLKNKKRVRDVCSSMVEHLSRKFRK